MNMYLMLKFNLEIFMFHSFSETSCSKEVRVCARAVACAPDVCGCGNMAAVGAMSCYGSFPVCIFSCAENTQVSSWLYFRFEIWVCESCACLIAWSPAHALNVDIPQDVFEFARGDNITLPCKFVPKGKPERGTITWTAIGNKNEQVRLLFFCVTDYWLFLEFFPF